MTLIPEEDYISHPDRTVDNVRDALEDIVNVINEIGGGEFSGTEVVMTISSNSLQTPPTTQMINVRSQDHGSNGSDDLDTIPVTDTPAGRIIYLRNAMGDTTWSDTDDEGTLDYVRVVHTGSPTVGKISLASGKHFTLAERRVLVLRLTKSGSILYWAEIARYFPDQIDDYRLYLGLKSGSLVDVSTNAATDSANNLLKVGGDHLVAGDILKVDTNGLIVAAVDGVDFGGADADTLGGLGADDFVQIDEAGVQVIAGAIQAEGTVTVDSEAWGADPTQKSKVEFELNGTRRGLISSEADSATAGDETLAIYTTSGASLQSGIEIKGQAWLADDDTTQRGAVKMNVGLHLTGGDGEMPYINFGTGGVEAGEQASGPDGYGFRDKNGVIQYRSKWVQGNWLHLDTLAGLGGGGILQEGMQTWAWLTLAEAGTGTQLSPGTQYSANHNLVIYGISTPRLLHFYLKCVSQNGDNGYDIGDHIPLGGSVNDSSHATFWFNDTEIGFSYKTTFVTIHKTPTSRSTIDNSKWDVVVQAWL